MVVVDFTCMGSLVGKTDYPRPSGWPDGDGMLVVAFLFLPTLHNWFLRHVRSGTPLIVSLQKRVRSSPMDKLCVLCASLGNECTYLLLLPLVAWNMDIALGRKLVVLWGIGFYISNYLKDLLLLPRPYHINDEVLNLLPGAAVDRYGLPCTRAFSATALPFYLLLLSHKEYPDTFPQALLAALMWSLLVSCSRIYLGIHSPTDILAGMMLAVLLVILWLTVGTQVDRLITSPYSWVPLWQPLISWLLLMAYPAPKNCSPAFTETAMVGGFATGCVVGSMWFLQDLLRPPHPTPHLCPSADCPWVYGVTSLAGLALLVATHMVAARFFLSVLPPLDCFSPQDTLAAARIIKYSHLNTGPGAHPWPPSSSSTTPLSSLYAYHHQNGSSQNGESHHHGSHKGFVSGTGGGCSSSAPNHHHNSHSKHHHHTTAGGGGGTNGMAKKGSSSSSTHVLLSHKAFSPLPRSLGLSSDEYGYEVMVPVFYCTYLVIGFNTAFTVPLLMQATGSR